jgi:hypothetical protein
MDQSAVVGGSMEGTLRLEAVADELWVGAATVSFPMVGLPGGASPEEVEFGATFRARVLPPGEPRPACQSSEAPGRR